MAFILAKALLAFTLAFDAAAATQSFANRGTTSGWDSFNHENKGTVQEVTNVVYPDITNQGTALKMTQIYDPNWNGRYHSEAVKYNVYKKGDTGFYGFAFRLQDSWEFTPKLSFNLAQFIADFTSLGCTETYMPSTMVWLEGDQLQARVKHGDVCPQSAQQTTPFRNLATVTPGVWHRVEIQASWRSDNTGYFKLWFDGNKVSETFDIPTTVTDGRAFQFRVGLYANGWHDKGYSGNQATRQVWYDQVAVGTDFADAAPDKW
ncbi:hypothetical protein PG991_013431 [Apiospora marii]|uniref:Polysaccharide lyase family 20 protein n=1 Tax=Apiospora marii TaxID=335849 RepID=A0ABR1R5Z8_9PEZI